MAKLSTSSGLAQKYFDAAFTESDRRIAQAFLWALKPLTNLRRPVPLPSMIAFLMVALDEGQGVTTYARGAGIDHASMSRILHSIGDRGRNGSHGLGLIRIERRLADQAKTQIFLTSKGRAIAKDIFSQLRRIKY
ncbi:MAG: MarR family winged helix-turn-helix transcriptional regulator [Xanthobacteraceae bacterium]